LHVQRKPCTYLLLRLAQSQKTPKRASIWPTSPMSSIVCPKQFLSLCYISANLCTYLVPRLTPYLNGTKWASTWPTSPRSSFECAQNDFWSYCTFGTNHALILCGDSHYLQIDQIERPLDPCHLGVPLGAQVWFPSLLDVRCKACTYLASRLTLSPNRLK
jgi:hypothetical protein